MNTKKCTVEKINDPPPSDPCLLQKIKEKEAAAIKICQRPPVEQSVPPDCHGLCIERIKNPPIDSNKRQPIACIIQRQLTGTARCDALRCSQRGSAESDDLDCPASVINSAPPPDPCEEQKKRSKIEECKEKLKQYLE